MDTRNLIPVEGHSNLFRDPSSGAIINITKSKGKNRAFAEANKRRDADIQTLKDEMSEIKSLLVQFLERNNNGNN